MAENTQSVLERTAADQWKVLPSGLTVLVRPMPGYSGTHVIYATRFGSIDRDFRLGEREVHLPAGVAHFLEHKMFEDEDGDAFAKFAKTGANANAFTAFDRTCYLFTATEQLDESSETPGLWAAIGTTTTWMGATAGGRMRPSSSPWVMMIAPTRRVETPQLVWNG